MLEQMLPALKGRPLWFKARFVIWFTFWAIVTTPFWLAGQIFRLLYCICVYFVNLWDGPIKAYWNFRHAWRETE